ncbi:MAG: hypothetical protein LUD55_07575 [Oscillospiraceae bacterium]|nr:hypothetical protein [Oscillospiraceae bacterium]MCD8192634.1 hypothetical protein [Oscillospiraceae bacterium]
MENTTLELLDMLYTMVTEAWGVPLGNEKCIIERDKAMNLLDEIKNQLPSELAEASRLVSARDTFINNAKREAEAIRKSAEDKAKEMVEEQEIVRAARVRAAEITTAAEKRSKELYRVANEYVDDALRRTEEAINTALNEVHTSRASFRSVAEKPKKAEPARKLTPDD